MSKEIIEIHDCPHCGGIHRYWLEVRRPMIIKMLTDTRGSSQRVKITRLFICPVKGEHYQATFYLHDSTSEGIENVTVLGLVEEDNYE